MLRFCAAPLMLLALVSSQLVASRLSAQEVKWRYDYAAAKREAAETGRPLFLKFGTEWCGPCRKLDSTTLRDAKVVAALNAGFIPVKLDGDKEADLMASFKVTGFPTLLVATPEGKMAGSLPGFQSPAQVIALLDKAPASNAIKPVAENRKATTKEFDADRSLYRELVVQLDSKRSVTPIALPTAKAWVEKFDADGALHDKLRSTLNGSR